MNTTEQPITLGVTYPTPFSGLWVNSSSAWLSYVASNGQTVKKYVKGGTYLPISGFSVTEVIPMNTHESFYSMGEVPEIYGVWEL